MHVVSQSIDAFYASLARPVQSRAINLMHWFTVMTLCLQNWSKGNWGPSRADAHSRRGRCIELYLWTSDPTVLDALNASPIGTVLATY